MKNESATPITEQPIYTQSTCPECGGHTLKAKVEWDANVTGFDDRPLTSSWTRNRNRHSI